MHLGLMGKSGEINPLKTPFRGILKKSTVGLCVVWDFETINFQCFRQAKLVFLIFRATTNSAWSVYIVGLS